MPHRVEESQLTVPDYASQAEEKCYDEHIDCEKD